MSKSVVAAEHAAIEGRAPSADDFDTQDCHGIQDDVWSSSPPRSQVAVQNIDGVVERARIELNITLSSAHITTEGEQGEEQGRDSNGCTAAAATTVEAEDTGYELPLPPPSKINAQSIIIEAEDIESKLPPPHTSKIYAQNVVALSESQAGNVLGSGPSSKKQVSHDIAGRLGKVEAMDDLTQGSSLTTPTQKNDDSVYAKHGFDVSIQKLIPEKVALTTHESLNKHSLVTESTPGHTYGENETGHVHFDHFEPNEVQDAFANDEDLPEPESSQPIEPQTPAPAANPFANQHKGSVMKGFDLFNATQPSSIAKHIMPSTSSSRPSPGNYDRNDYTSPVKATVSSPLAQRLPSSPTSPLQSSVRDILRSRSVDSPTVPELRKRGLQSFVDRPHKPIFHEPRPYVSMQISQERRRTSSPVAEDSDSDSDLDSLPMRQIAQKQRNLQIAQELSAVEALRLPSSVIEVPATGRKGRRRSLSEDYVAEPESNDLRETLNEEIIADSQSLPPRNKLEGEEEKEKEELEENSRSTASQHSPELTHEVPSSPPADSGLVQQPSHSLPQSGSRDARTPMASKIPETSPQAGSPIIRPLGEITTLSFDEASDILDAPGFTQDDAFNDLTRQSLSPINSPSRQRRPQSIPENTNAVNEEDGTPTKSSKSNTGRSTRHVSAAISTPHSSLTSLPSSSPQMPSPLAEHGPQEAEPEQEEPIAPIAPVAAIQTDPDQSSGPKPDSGTKRKTQIKYSTKTKSALARKTRKVTSTNRTLSNKARQKATPVDAKALPTRASKRKSMISNRESSADPLAGPGIASNMPALGLFGKMAFAVSYINEGQNKEKVVKLLTKGGSRILEGGFHELFEVDTMVPTAIARGTGFVALIADEYSRRVKYIQALALGLPCISGVWVEACVKKGEIVSWAPYLLCAGVSTYLNATSSRTIQPYPIESAKFTEVIAKRAPLLDGRSIVLITGKGKEAQDQRKAHIFLARALGPAKLELVQDNAEARDMLLKSTGEWDTVHVHKDKKAADAAIFGSTSSSKKRKRGGPDEAPPPKRIRVIEDEIIVQSLIIGSLLID